MPKNQGLWLATAVASLLPITPLHAEMTLDEALKGVTLSGLVEVDASYAEDYEDNNTSDIVVATVELALDAKVHEWASAHVLFLYEEDDTEDVTVDEAILTLGNLDKSPFFLDVGKMYVPFGGYASHFISDPLTLEVGEAQETALLVGAESAGVYGSVYTFNGDTKEADDDDEINSFGVSLGYAMETDTMAFDVMASYLNNMADSGGITDAVSDPEGLNDTVAGAGIQLVAGFGGFAAIAEYVGALDQFETADLAFNGEGAEPKAWNVELGYTFPVGMREVTVAVGYQGTDEAIALDLPETRILAGVSVGLFDNTSLSLELAQSQDYDEEDGGTGEEANSAILQLAIEF